MSLCMCGSNDVFVLIMLGVIEWDWSVIVYGLDVGELIM